jgi:hypothetical protein
MLLRDHPLMSFKGMSSWPPVWTWIDGHEKKSARGEIGILKEVTLSKITVQAQCNRPLAEIGHIDLSHTL